MDEAVLARTVAVFQTTPIHTLTTVDGDAPRARLMAMQVGADLTMMMGTFASSRKVEQIRANAKVCVVSAGGMDAKDYAIVDGLAEVRDDKPMKEACWIPPFEKYFSGPDDPNYLVIRIRPARSEYWTMESHDPQVLTFETE